MHAIIENILIDIHNDKCIFTKSPELFIKNFSCNFPSERQPCSVCVNLLILAKKEWRKEKREKERGRKEGEREKERIITVDSYRSSQGTASWLSMWCNWALKVPSEETSGRKREVECKSHKFKLSCHIWPYYSMKQLKEMLYLVPWPQKLTHMPLNDCKRAECEEDHRGHAQQRILYSLL